MIWVLNDGRVVAYAEDGLIPPLEILTLELQGPSRARSTERP